MKEFIAEPGGRYTYADDVIHLQDMVLGLSTLFVGCSNFIVSGCVVSGSRISAGYVWINGKIRYYEGCSNALFPYYIYEKNGYESVAYANEVNKRGRCCYLSLGGVRVPETADAITGQLPQFIEVRTDYAPRLSDKFFGRYALMTDCPFAQQTVRKDLLLTGKFTAEKGLESRHSLVVAPSGSSCMLRGYFPAAGVARLEVSGGSSAIAAVEMDAESGVVSVMSKGVTAALFDSGSCRLLDLVCSTVRAGGLYVSGDQLLNAVSKGDAGAVRVNYSGYQEGKDYYRNFDVYDGKGCHVPLLRVEGCSQRVYVHGGLYVDGDRGVWLQRSPCGGSLGWVSEEGEVVSRLGYLTDAGRELGLENKQGELVFLPQSYVDVRGDLRINGVSVGLTYATQEVLDAGLRKKVDVVEGKGLSSCDLTQELCDKLVSISTGVFAGPEVQQREGYVTTSQVLAELSKKANILLDGLDEGQQRTAAKNLGVYPVVEADLRFGRLSELFQDFITYLVASGKSSTEAQEVLRDKLGAAGRQDLEENYIRRDGKLSDLVLTDDEARKLACKTLGAAYAADYEPKLVDSGWLQMSNSGSGTDTRELFVRQIGSVVCIQGRINTAKRDGNNQGGVVALIPNTIQPPKYGLRTTVTDWNDDHKYNRGASFVIDGNSRKLQIYESGMYNVMINLNFSYMV